MSEPLHHSTLAAITRLAQERGLPLVRADDEVVIVGDEEVSKTMLGWHSYTWAARNPSKHGRVFKSPLAALRHALREGR